MWYHWVRSPACVHLHKAMEAARATHSPGSPSAAAVCPVSKSVCTVRPGSGCNDPTCAECKHRHNCIAKLQQRANTREQRVPVKEQTYARHRVT